MGLISSFIIHSTVRKTLQLCLICAVLFCFGRYGGFAQDASSSGGSAGSSAADPFQTTSLSSEIKAIENIINAPDTANTQSTNSAARAGALQRLARLQELSGDMAAASKSWLDAAKAAPDTESGDSADMALVSGARCLAAIGEWEKAVTAIMPVLAGNRQGPALFGARYIEACAQAWTGGSSSLLQTLLQNPDYSNLYSAILYTLWRYALANPDATSATAWKDRLLAEYPLSPEARIASSDSAAQARGDTFVISPMPGPHWLFMAATDTPPASGSIQASTAPIQSDAAAQASAAIPPTPVPETTISENTLPPSAPVIPSIPELSVTPQTAQSTHVLQTGLFGLQANATKQKDALQKAGFQAEIITRIHNDRQMWAVTVPAGNNMNKTIEDLKKAGFDSFPL